MFWQTMKDPSCSEGTRQIDPADGVNEAGVLQAHGRGMVCWTRGMDLGGKALEGGGHGEPRGRGCLMKWSPY